MARPNQIILNSLTPGIASLTLNYTNPSVPDTDELFLAFRVPGSGDWNWLKIPTGASTFDLSVLEPSTEYEVGLKASNTIAGAGPISNLLRATTLASAFADPVVAWDENGVDGSGAGTQLISVDNTGSNGAANWDLDTLFGDTTKLTEQSRNGRRCWQSGGGGASGIRTSPNPPTPAISQPCTVYLTASLFFVDGTSRWALRGDSNKLQIRFNSSGWSLQSSGVGPSGVGTAVADGRVYVVECRLNNTLSKLRVIDSNGNDSGSVTSSIAYSGAMDIESVAWDDILTAGEDATMQVYSIHIMDGLGDQLSRIAKRNELMQKGKSGAAIVVYPSFPPEPLIKSGGIAINRGLSI